MTRKIDNDAVINSIRLKEVATAPTGTASGYGNVYIRNDGLYLINDSGLDIGPFVTGSCYDIGARIYNSSNISIANTTVTLLTFNSERYDTDSLHSGSSSQFYINTAGKYLIIGNVQFADNTTGFRQVYIRLNGATSIGLIRLDPLEDSSFSSYVVSTLYKLSVGDYVELAVYQNSGDALNVENSSNTSPEFMIQKIG